LEKYLRRVILMRCS